MSAKLRIDLSQGIVDAEGTEDFLREIYRDFQNRVSGAWKIPDERKVEENGMKDSHAEKERTSVRGTTTERRSGEKRGKSRQPVLVKNLDLATKGTRVGLKDFAARYRPLKGAAEFSGLSVYYLAKIGNVEKITADHVYTCFKHLDARVPEKFDQSLWDTARRKGWIDTTSLEDIKLPLAGENWVEHDLPKAQSTEE